MIFCMFIQREENKYINGKYLYKIKRNKVSRLTQWPAMKLGKPIIVGDWINLRTSILLL